MLAFGFHVEKHFENRTFLNGWPNNNHAISLSKLFFSNTNPKWLVIAAFLNFSGIVWTKTN